jgi:glycosyltransferase involved in cell wall biosynthesis
MPELVTVGVPVYRGALFLEETLRCIQSQTYRDLEVIMSLDGPDPVCEAICRSFLTDSRFRLAIQPERLGWAGNISWLMSEASGDFWYFHQQDDLTSENYVETLLGCALKNPAAALVYCDMDAFGTNEGPIIRLPSVLGSPLMRQLAFLNGPYHAVGFRGLTRMQAVRLAGGVPTNEYENFACDTAWLAAIAVSGELHRVPGVLYRKRYHASNVHLEWSTWNKERAVAAWTAHCVNMLDQAIRIEASTQELRLLWFSAIRRLLSPETAGLYLHLRELSPEDEMGMFNSFLAGAQGSKLHTIDALLGSNRQDLREWSLPFFRLVTSKVAAAEAMSPPSDAVPAIADTGPANSGGWLGAFNRSVRRLSRAASSLINRMSSKRR